MRMELSREDRETLERLEADLWREEIRFDRSRMSEVMAPDFLEFGRSGRVYRRDGILALPRGPLDAALPLPDFDAPRLAPDVAQVTYNSAVRSGGVVEWARRSSIWSRGPGGWVLRFHQGTPFQPGA